MGTDISDHAEDLFVQLANDYSDERACRWIRRKFESFSSAAAFDVPCEEKIEQNNFTDARVLGYVTELRESKSSAANRPLLVASVRLRKPLSHRPSRLAQFNFAKKIIKKAIDSGRHNLSGVPSQGLFFFYDDCGNFRISLVSGQIDAKNKFVFNSAKRQSFVVNPGAPNNIVRRRLNPVIGLSFEAVKEAFSVDQLTKEFYNKLFAWYQWAMQGDVTPHPFPNDPDTPVDDREKLSEGLIRLITRLMFVWFIKQKGLVPKELFLPEVVKTILKVFNPEHMKEDNYYRCILQNLFFATLNCPKLNAQGKKYRKFVKSFQGKSDERGVKTCYRYRNEFVDPDGFVEFMMKVPFLNCALFDCLDREKKPEEGVGEMLIDGFSQRNEKRMAHLPNGLFFDGEKGLIKLFNQYEFTVDENNADDSDVALDPELLGKVFENLLGAFNPETKETARKSTGSFYTPREIVDYMVDESLKNYIKTKVPSATDDQLADLFDRSKANEINTRFNEDQRKEVLEAVLTCRILDPACGSGAFPMGILHCMVRLLDRLDPNCRRSNEMLYARYTKESRERDPSESEEMVEERRKELESRSREELKNPAYARKLYLIENCIYGVDIQPVATQISKLRFFISLLCDQFKSNYDPDAENAGLLSLPNLEAKFVCANTLISLPKLPENELALSKENVKEKQEELKRNRHRIFGARTAGTKAKYKAEDLRIRRDIENIVKSTFAPDAAKIGLLNKELDKLTAARALVAEPKMVDAAKGPKKAIQDDWFAAPKPEQQALSLGKVEVDVNEPKRTAIDRDIKNIKQSIEKELQKGKSHNQGAIDEFAHLVASWDPFDQNATSSYFDPEWMFGLKEGFDIVIGNPPYVQLQAEGGKLAKMYLDKGYETFDKTGDLYCLFYERGNNLLCGTGILAYISSDKWMCCGYGYALRKYILDKTNPVLLIDFSGQRLFETATVEANILFLSKLSNQKFLGCVITDESASDLSVLICEKCVPLTFDAKEFWIIKSIQEQSVFKKVCQHGVPLKNWNVQINFGIKTGLDEAFVVDEDTCVQLIEEDRESRKILRPLFRGKDIGRYVPNKNVVWLVCAHNGYGSVEPIDVGKYCAIKRFMSAYLVKLKKRTDQGCTPYNLRDCAYWKSFSKPKVMWKRIGSILRFCYSDQEVYGKDTTCMMTGERIKYLTAFLNSKMAAYLLKDSPRTGTGDLLVSVQAMEPLRVAKPTEVEESAVVKLLDRILSAKKADPNADTSALEAEIDQLVYKLYDLTPEEIAIVEGRSETVKPPAAKESVEKAQAPRKMKQTKSSPKKRDDEWME